MIFWLIAPNPAFPNHLLRFIFIIIYNISYFLYICITRVYSVLQKCRKELLLRNKKVLFDNEKLNFSYKSNIKFLSWQTLTASLLYIKQSLLWNRLGDEGGKSDPFRRSLHLNSHCIPFCPYIYTVTEKPIQSLNGTAL